jgi:hypothetical protein
MKKVFAPPLILIAAATGVAAPPVGDPTQLRTARRLAPQCRIDHAQLFSPP